MSDSVTKWHDMQDDLEKKALIDNIPSVRRIENYMPTPEEKIEACTILSKYSSAAVIEAARILKLDGSTRS